MDLGTIGIWTSSLGTCSAGAVRDAANLIEALGFRTVWVPEAFWSDPFVLADRILAATTGITVATGIANIFGRTPQVCTNATRALASWYPDRFVLGLGVSHRPMVTSVHGGDYSKPRTAMIGYLDGLAGATFAGPPVAVEPPVVLAALGPKMLELARARTAGAHPYNSPVQHTAAAREILGPDRLLAPEVKVVFETDAEAARALARKNLPLRLENYGRNMVRAGFDETDVRQMSDEVVDALVGWGSDERIRAQLQRHLDAGADHVAVQVLSADGAPPLDGWRRLAELLH